jgi:hypothetical protein
MKCNLTVPDSSRPERKVCSREGCGRVVVHQAAAEMIEATCRVGRPPGPLAARVIPEPFTFERHPCDRRGELLGSVPLGGCCGNDGPVRVARCAEFAVCSEEAVADGPKQRVHGVRPTSCESCGKWRDDQQLRAVEQVPGVV